MLDIFGSIFCAAEMLMTVSCCDVAGSGKTSLRAPSQSQANGTDKRAFSGAVGSNDHVQTRTRFEFGRGVGDEIRKFNSNDCARLIL